MKQNFRHGKLVTIEKVRKSSKQLKQRARWLCQCDCGNQKIIDENELYGRGTQSCGCLEYKTKKIYDREDYLERMKEKIKKNTFINQNGCWIWTASQHRQGYGNIRFRKRPSLVHRVSWILYNGEIPEVKILLHTCDEPACCNPEHLRLGTQLDNVQDAYGKGRWKPGTLPRQNKLTIDQVIEIRKLHGDGMTRKELQAKYGMSQTGIEKIVTGKSWKEI